jgi:hypothetical protein
MRINRGLLFWGLAFITAGAVALGVQQGVVPREVVADAWRLWPLILVAIGISIIAARTPLAPLGSVVGALLLGTFLGGVLALGPGVVASCGGATTSDRPPTQMRDGAFGARAEVDIDANCAALAIATQAGSTWTFAGSGTREATIDNSQDRLRIHGPENDWFGGDRQRRQWKVVLPTDPTLELSIDANAAQSMLDLRDAKLDKLELDANAGDAHLDLGGASVDELDIEVNAGKASVLLDDQSMVTGSLSANAGSLEVCAPASVALQIKTDDNVAFSDNLGESGLQSVGDDTWQTSRYGGAEKKVTLTVDGNAANFTLNPDGGWE